MCVALLLLGAIALVPWWVSLILWVPFVMWVDLPYEAILAGFYFDTLYMIPAGITFFPGTILFMFIVIVVFFIKPRIAFFSH
ncbi:MAG: hypothetical protein COV34_02340 [Candidatus Zambryskibacteria bacterium CG10_big_fil_rev_8_21_14_0_10_42_12]|uniref:Uncharacterized protein n=1 Tax=Candidatus Zambryskibacteria bacterium CG10_big_fil_rev_8_21_14_0_10_42_12 TaxID=1975115 RepID=A0A2H0QWC6_9BACT|nr:MAG: hypothetical protein COV34_02340 [Candidatus Zambryskibacteria bacterium CG10_big_fil_rev_8_21_14_0_10_42_12]